MERFRFRLETLLKVRRADRQQRRVELAQAYQAERLIQQQMDSLAAELGTAWQKTRQASAPGEVDVDQLLELQRYTLTIQSQTQQLGTQQTRIREEVERRRRALVEADRQVKTLEKLREKQQAAFRLGELKIEQKLLDEAATKRRR